MKCCFAILPKNIKSELEKSEIPIEVKVLFIDFKEFISYKLLRGSLLLKSISHQIDFIPGLSLQNKAPHRLAPVVSEEINRQV